MGLQISFNSRTREGATLNLLRSRNNECFNSRTREGATLTGVSFGVRVEFQFTHP